MTDIIETNQTVNEEAGVPHAQQTGSLTMKDALETIRELTDVIQKENALIMSGSTEEFSVVADTKRALGVRLERRTPLIAEALDVATPEERAEFMEFYKSFREALDVNERTLILAKRASGMIHTAIRKAVEREQSDGCYRTTMD
jgi:hypothetical protein